LGRRPTGILSHVARGADHARAGGFGRGSLFIDGSGQGAQLTFSFTAPAGVLQGGGVTFSNATILDVDLNVPSPGNDAFTEAAVDSTSFGLDSNGSGPFSASITVDVEVDSGASTVNGNAAVPEGGSGTVAVTGGPTQTLSLGNFSLPLG
jgi:hypothetical protein